MEFKGDNFDKEFTLNKKSGKKRKKTPRAKLPSWLMILAGVAVIGGVVLARQPGIRPADDGTRTTVNMPASQMVSGDRLVYNDQQVSSTELEARFISQGDEAASQHDTDPAQSAVTVPAEEKPAPEPEKTAEVKKPVGKDVEVDNSTIAWLNNKAYEVSIQPGTGDTAAPHESASSNVPVTVLDSEGNAKKQPQTTVFELDGKQYALQLTELNNDEVPAQTPEEPVLWVDKVPLEVTLSTDGPVSLDKNRADSADVPVNVSLNPLPAEKTSALQQERFGTDFNAPAPVEEDPFAAEFMNPTPTPLPTEVPQDENWFASFFNGIFGSNPTEVPTPQVTVIALTPTPTVVLPTATPLVVRVAPTEAAAEGPVRLDESDDSGKDEGKTAKNKEETAIVPTLLSDDADTAKAGDVKADPTKGAPSKIEPVIVDKIGENSDPALTDETENSDPAPTRETEPEELPHTGGLEGWNLPSLLAMLAGLLLVIIGVRRLRTH